MTFVYDIKDIIFVVMLALALVMFIAAIVADYIHGIRKNRQQKQRGKERAEDGE